MKRNDFSIESKILGRDFNGLIEGVGGKTAGIELLMKISEKYSLFHRWEIPNYKVLSTKLCKNLDNHLNLYKDELSDFVCNHNYNENLGKIYSIIKDKLKDKEIDNFIQRLKREKIEYFHLRSSTTIEDWKDDKYYGTFETKEGSFKLMKNYKNKKISSLEIKSSINNLFCDFFIKKFYGGFDLENESLGILGMETIGKEEDKLHVTIYSSYPEKDSSIGYIEIWKVRGNLFNDCEARQLVKISKNDMEVFQMNQLQDVELADDFLFENILKEKNENSIFYSYGKRDRFQRENPFSIVGQRCALSKCDLLNLYDVSQSLQNILEKPVNLEILVELNSENLYNKNYVQLRLVPRLDEKREIKELKPLTENYIPIGKTPFVKGSFKIEYPLIMPKNKKSGHEPYMFSEKFIMIDNESSKGHRSYVRDSNVVALLYVDSCTAISHGFVIEPSFLEREKWKSIGWINQERNLHKYLFECGEGDSLESGVKYPAIFAVSKIPFILESDGREGRIYIRKKYEKDFNNPRPNSEPLFKSYVNPKSQTDAKNLPF